MPPLRPIPEEITSLTDEELFAELLKYNYSPGPVMPSTRHVYERKLFQLQTGQEAVSSVVYEPVDQDDEDDDQDSVDEEVVLQPHQPRQRLTRSTRAEVERSPPRYPPTPRQAQQTSTTNRSQSVQGRETSKKTPTTSSGWFSVWVKLLLVLVVAFLVFLVVKNMESDAGSQGPDIPEQIDV